MNEKRPVRIANAYGFYGDRVDAALEMVTGGDIDVLTGDYLAELTMFLLHKARSRDADAGYAVTFIPQLEQVLALCLEKGIKIVANAGGLNPAGLVREIRALAERQGLSPKVAYVDGDDVRDRLPELQRDGHKLAHLDTGLALEEAGVDVVTANAYLGAWPIVRALDSGADIVITGRVTDASMAVAPAAWWHGWKQDDWNELAGAVAVGHVLECGPQATGGNYSFFTEITDDRYPGFPIAEVAADGSAVITKHDDTGGIVNVDTVKAQLLYEIQSPAYYGPDVTTWFDSIQLEQVGKDRVLLSDTRGTPPIGEVKVAVNFLGGYRNSMTAVITGLDIESKARRAEEIVFSRLGGKHSFDEVDVQLLRYDHDQANVQAEASAHLVMTVKDRDPNKVGRRFSAAVMELFLGGYPGFYATTPPSRESAYGVYWPTLIPGTVLEPTVHFDDGSAEVVALPPGDRELANIPTKHETSGSTGSREDFGPATRAPLGKVFAARSGDKGGNANIGVWSRTEEGYQWLVAYLTEEKLRELIPEARELEVRRYLLPNLFAINYVIVGILGEGVASSTRPDAQAKALGEYLRARLVDLPDSLERGAPSNA